MNFKYQSCEKAALAGDLEELKRMHKFRCPWNELTPSYASKKGHLECLKYAHENGCPWDWTVISDAAWNGHLDCLKYAYENGCEWYIYSDLLRLVASHGYLECLRYLHEIGYKLDSEDIPVFAALNGHLECFKYCFQFWDDSQKFWKSYRYYDITDKIDLDDPVWRRLFTLDLSYYPTLQTKVENKKKEIEELKKISIELLENKIPKDVLKHCLYPYF